MAWLKTLLRIPIATLLLAWGCTLYATESPQRVNVNTADAATIASVLTGVGLKKAAAIVAYREANGRFDTPGDLAKVKGIGAAIIARNAGKIVVSEAGADTAAAPPADDAASHEEDVASSYED